jgi:ppGpp synthetase/RelA/SpoT-type nucleotidyltranferase
MSDFLNENIEVYKKLQILYKETIFKTLEIPTEELVKLFGKLLDEKAQEYSLLSKNSAYPSPYFQIKERVKKEDSFYEKLIRKDIGLLIAKRFSILSDPTILESRKAEIINAIKEIDDLIGLRIVTELKEDCNNVYKLLLNSTEFFQKNQISFSEIEAQPKKMRNGLEIYRIKGKYQNVYSFELQIKSKIEEAWGDMDHSLFYKDYSVSPIKDTVQVTMNNVGELLDRIEKLLYDLRESGANYEENADHLKFQKYLDDEVAKLLQIKFGVPYNTKDSIDFLRFFRSKAIDGGNSAQLENIHFNHLSWEVNDLFCQNYIRIRNTNHNLIIIESLFLSWKELNDEDFNLTENNYENHLKSFLDLFIEFLADELSEDKNELDTSIKHLSEYTNKSDLFLKTSALKEAQEICKRLDNIALEEESVKDKIKSIKQCFRIVLFEGRIEDYLSKILEDEEEEISDAFLKIRDAIQNKNTFIDKQIYQISTICLDIIRKMQNQ